MSEKHTPGPWYVEKQEYKSSSFYIRGTDAKGKRLAWAKGAVAHIPRSTVMPSAENARLIAAAPALLVALQTIRKRPFMELTEREKIIDAAIAKATGEQP